MARQPFYGRGPGPAIARMDMNAATAPGRAYGQMYANLGKQVGGAIEKYGLNKEKRNKLQATLEGQLSTADPSVMQAFTMTGDEAYDKKNQTLFDKVQSGNASIPDLERANGLLAGRTTQENAMLKKQNAETLQEKNELELSLGKALKDPTIAKALADAQVAESNSMYAKSIASADYAGKIQDNQLKSAQTEYQQLKTKVLENSKQYTPGQTVDIEGASGNKVSFVWTGETLQPLNDDKYVKDINKAIIQGLDSAELEAYIDRTYDVGEDGMLKPKEGGSFFGYGIDAPKKNPMMEQAISILSLHGKDDALAQQKVKSSIPKEEPTISTQEEFDALPSGAIFIENGVEYKKP